jgi:hypothetical protein
LLRYQLSTPALWLLFVRVIGFGDREVRKWDVIHHVKREMDGRKP